MRLSCLILAALFLGVLPPVARAEKDRKPSKLRFFFWKKAETGRDPKTLTKDIVKEDPGLYSKQQEVPEQGIVTQRQEVQGSVLPRDEILRRLGQRPVKPLGPGVLPAVRGSGFRPPGVRPAERPSEPDKPKDSPRP